MLHMHALCDVSMLGGVCVRTYTTCLLLLPLVHRKTIECDPERAARFNRKCTLGVAVVIRYHRVSFLGYALYYVYFYSTLVFHLIHSHVSV